MSSSYFILHGLLHPHTLQNSVASHSIILWDRWMFCQAWGFAGGTVVVMPMCRGYLPNEHAALEALLLRRFCKSTLHWAAGILLSRLSATLASEASFFCCCSLRTGVLFHPSWTSFFAYLGPPAGNIGTTSGKEVRIGVKPTHCPSGSGGPTSRDASWG